jgi:hypothetical protein
MDSIKGSELYVAYITSGREKYEYKTEFVGGFTEHADALKAVFSKLVSSGRVLEPESVEDSLGDITYMLKTFKDENSLMDYIEDVDERPVDFPFHFLNPNTKLEDIIKDWNDSFYKDGWDYKIKKITIQ